jgi:hypothetical protein
VAAVLLVALAPGTPARDPVTRAANGATARVRSLAPGAAVINASVVEPAQDAAVAANRDLPVTRGAAAVHRGIATVVYTTTLTGPVDGAPATMTYDQLAQRNGGRLPIGVRATAGQTSVPVTERSVNIGTFWVDAATGRIVDQSWEQTITITAQLDIGATAIGAASPVKWALSDAQAKEAVASARSAASDVDRRTAMRWLAALAAVAALVLVAFVLVATLRGRRPRAAVPPVTQTSELVGS